MEAYCFQAYADALEVIPTTLAENAGLNPIAIVTELRNRHALGECNAGINVRKVRLSFSVRFGAMSRLGEIGTNLEYLGGGCCAAVVGIDECSRTRYRDRDATLEDRRLCAGTVGRAKKSSCVRTRRHETQNHHIQNKQYRN
jgi:TCP-1/cpn60 chaperonin family